MQRLCMSVALCVTRRVMESLLFRGLSRMVKIIGEAISIRLTDCQDLFQGREEHQGFPVSCRMDDLDWWCQPVHPKGQKRGARSTQGQIRSVGPIWLMVLAQPGPGAGPAPGVQVQQGQALLPGASLAGLRQAAWPSSSLRAQGASTYTYSKPRCTKPACFKGVAEVHHLPGSSALDFGTSTRAAAGTRAGLCRPLQTLLQTPDLSCCKGLGLTGP